eukprot:296611_1
MATAELALELQIAPNHLDNDQDGSADFFSQLFDGENWEELPSFDDIRSKMHEHHESIKKIQKSCHKKVHNVVDSLIFQTLCILVVVFDFILALTSIINDQDIVSYLTMAIIALYVIEILLRIYAYGFKKFFTSILNIIDFIAVMGSLILYIYSIYAVYALLVKILRWVRVARSTYTAIFSRSKKIQQAIRNMQRSNLKGYKDDKYDLDITYITDHILIMSRPAVKKIKQFQHDSLTDVKNFLDEKHRDHYKIFDLCVYDDEETDNKSNPNLLATSISEEHLSTPALTDFSSSVLSFVPINIDRRDGIKNTEYAVFGADIINDYAFTGITVLPLEKVFEFAEIATQYTDENASNIIVIQSTSGLGRSMFMTACLLFYYYPNASLADVIRFIQHGRVAYTDKDKKDDNYMFRKFVPSQLRYYRYFGTLITHCSKLSENIDDNNDEDDVDEMDMELDRGLTHHVETMHYHNQQYSLYDDQLIASINAELDEFNALSNGSKWNFYHESAMDMLNARIGIVIKHIAIYNYFDEIDPYVDWECDIFQWKQNDNNGMNVLSCVEYDTYKYGADTKPGKNSALIKRYEDAKTRVIEKDFGLRFYKSKTNDEQHKRKLCAQLILHSHFISLDDENCITFKKEEIDFVNNDINNKHFPEDFNIVVKAKILRKKA